MQWNDKDPLSDSELDALLGEWKIDPPAERLRMTKLPAGNLFSRKRRGFATAVLALAAVLTAVFVVTKSSRNERAPAEQVDAFTPIPYTLPLGDGESERVVRMNVSVAALTATGLRFPAADPTAIVTADVMVGDDGRARAIRLVKAVSAN